MRADLHTHTTASDGLLSPTQLVQRALYCDLDVLAICDHDSVAGLAEAEVACEGTALILVPGCELSASHEGLDVHILAYWVDRTDPVLLEQLELLRAARSRRAERMVAELHDAGISIALDEVLALSDGGAVGRSHVARALVESGEAQTVGDAFRRYLGRGKPFYVPKESHPPAEVVAAVREAGAVPVLAHPGVTGADALVPVLVDAGLLGIEAYHAEHTAEQREHYAELAQELGLLVTGGSDYHGLGALAAELGSVRLPDDALEAFLSSQPV